MLSLVYNKKVPSIERVFFASIRRPSIDSIRWCRVKIFVEYPLFAVRLSSQPQFPGPWSSIRTKDWKLYPEHPITEDADEGGNGIGVRFLQRVL